MPWMRTLGRLIRNDWQLILCSIVMPICAVFFLLPVKSVGPRDLEHPPVGRHVEVTFDRIQPLPWTLRDRHSDAITGRFVLGWLGKRALLVQIGLEPPEGLTYYGALNGLAGEPRKWVDAEPELVGVVYDASLAVSEPYKRLAFGYGSLAFSLWMLAIWVRRYRRRDQPEPVFRARNPLAPLLATERPRGDEVVAAVLRKHASVLGFALYFVLYALLVMALPAVIVADLLDGDMWTTPGRTFAMFALGLVVSSPVSILPFLAWRRRYRGGLARVARDGVLLSAVVVDATAQGTRAGWTSQRWLTRIDVEIPNDLLTRRFRATVEGPDWVAPGTGVQVLATPDDPRAIVITRDGDDVLARRTKIAGHARFPRAWIRTRRKGP